MKKKRVYIETLGCSKNEVDSELMVGVLDKNVYAITNDPMAAEIIIVNTCGFIEAAKEESIDAILELARYKSTARCEKLILAGCLAQRYSATLLDEIKEVDSIIGTGEINNLNEALSDSERKSIIGNINSDYIEDIERKVSTPYAYLRISEGCDNHCSYCIIPSLRGKHRSRKMDSIIKEAKSLVNQGVKEIILIAQNTTDYGKDLYGEFVLYKLLRELSKLEGLKLIRILYLYPDNISDNLIQEIKTNPKVAKYLDIPLQHISDSVLRGMNRKTSKARILETILSLRKAISDITLRTTFIVGFPGETENDFKELLDFVEEIKFDKLGVFTYSKEEGTTAFSMRDQISEQIKEQRRDEIMQKQEVISQKILASKLDKIYEALIEELEEVTDENFLYVARTFMDSPEIDGVLYVNSPHKLELGEYVRVKITDSMEYDLIGDIYEHC